MNFIKQINSGFIEAIAIKIYLCQKKNNFFRFFDDKIYWINKHL